MLKEKLMNAKETAADFWEENKYYVYGAGLGLLCVGEGYILGKKVTTYRLEQGLVQLALANPKFLNELYVAKRNVDEVMKYTK